MNVKGFMRERVGEPLLLKEAERTATAYSAAQRARITELSKAARDREDAALELREDRSAPAAVELHARASALAITALLVARGEHELEGVLEPPEAWARLSALLDAGALAEPPEELAVAAATACRVRRASRSIGFHPARRGTCAPPPRRPPAGSGTATRRAPLAS